MQRSNSQNLESGARLSPTITIVQPQPEVDERSDSPVGGKEGPMLERHAMGDKQGWLKQFQMLTQSTMSGSRLTRSFDGETSLLLDTDNSVLLGVLSPNGVRSTTGVVSPNGVHSESSDPLQVTDAADAAPRGVAGDQNHAAIAKRMATRRRTLRAERIVESERQTTQIAIQNAILPRKVPTENSTSDSEAGVDPHPVADPKFSRIATRMLQRRSAPQLPSETVADAPPRGVVADRNHATIAKRMATRRRAICAELIVESERQTTQIAIQNAILPRKVPTGADRLAGSAQPL